MDKLAGSPVEVDCLALGGLSLLERLVGYDEVIIIDAIQSENGVMGTVSRFDLGDLADVTTGHTTAVHDTSLQTALDVGRQMGAQLPERIQIVAIEAEQVVDFSEEMTPAVETAVPTAVSLVLAMVDEIVGQGRTA
jgi:hydrogenase maturation protease